MPTKSSARFHGVYAATLTPFQPNGDIDAELLAAHFRQVMEPEGIVGVLCNGHAGENFLLSRAETRLVVETAVREIGDRAIIASGVNAEATRDAVELARDAKAAGADAVVIFPPFSWALGVDVETIVGHHAAIVEAVDLPVFLYMTSIWAARMNYSAAVLERLLVLPNVVGIKEGSWDVSAYGRTRLLVDKVAPQVAVLASGDSGMFPSFVLGTEGSMVSLATIAGKEIVALYKAVQDGNNPVALALHERLQQLAEAIYERAPASHATARLKLAMQLLRHWPRAATRPPIGSLPEAEVKALQTALEEAGLMAKAIHG